MLRKYSNKGVTWGRGGRGNQDPSGFGGGCAGPGGITSAFPTIFVW